MLAQKIRAATSSAAAANKFVAFGLSVSPHVRVFPWSAPGFGAAFSNPASIPPNDGNGVCFSPDCSAIAVAHTSSPAIAVYAWTVSGFGTKYSDPATLPGGGVIGYGVSFSPAGDSIAVSHFGSPYVSIYPWSGSGFGTKYSDPATTPTGRGYQTEWSPDGTQVAVGHETSPYISAYPWSGSGFGTKYSNPAVLPPVTAGQNNGGKSIDFHPSGNALAISLSPASSGACIAVYGWSGSGFGAKFSDPASSIATRSSAVKFSPDGNQIVYGADSSPFINAYSWSGSGFGSRLSNPADTIPNTVNGIDFDTSGDHIFLAHTVNTAPNNFLESAYSWSASGFGARYLTGLTGTTNGLSVNYGEIA